MQSTVAFIFVLMMAIAFVSATPSRQQLEDYNQLMSNIDQLRANSYRSFKRSPHNIDTRALNQFKNCYFSPIQCVLMERRR